MPSADFCCVTLTIADKSAAVTQLAQQISPDKVHKLSPRNRRIYRSSLIKGFVTLGSLTQNLGLICDFCTSARSFASGFLRTKPRG